MPYYEYCRWLLLCLLYMLCVRPNMRDTHGIPFFHFTRKKTQCTWTRKGALHTHTHTNTHNAIAISFNISSFRGTNNFSFSTSGGISRKLFQVIFNTFNVHVRTHTHTCDRVALNGNDGRQCIRNNVKWKWRRFQKENQKSISNRRRSATIDKYKYLCDRIGLPLASKRTS